MAVDPVKDISGSLYIILSPETRHDLGGKTLCIILGNITDRSAASGIRTADIVTVIAGICTGGFG